MTLYNRYDDLSPMERVRLANEQYRRMAYKNITEQSRRLEEQNKEPEYEGKIVKDNTADISSELEIINSSFRSLISNIPRLKTFLEIHHPTGVYHGPPLYTFKTASIDKFVEVMSKNTFNLSLIYDTTKDIIKKILEEGEENFNYSQFNPTYKLYKAFHDEAVKSYNYFNGIFLNAERYLGVPASEKTTQQKITAFQYINDAKRYLYEFNNLSLEIFNLYDGLKEISKQYGKTKINDEQTYDFIQKGPTVGPVTVRPPAQRQYGATSAVKGSGKNRQLPWWLWM